MNKLIYNRRLQQLIRLEHLFYSCWESWQLARITVWADLTVWSTDAATDWVMKRSMSKSQDTNEHDLMEDLTMLRKYPSKENKCSFFSPPKEWSKHFPTVSVHSALFWRQRWDCAAFQCQSRATWEQGCRRKHCVDPLLYLENRAAAKSGCTDLTTDYAATKASRGNFK